MKIKFEIKDQEIEKLSSGSVLKNEITILAVSGLTNDTAEFNATGAASSTGSIILTNPNLRQATIEIKPSGYVKIDN